MKKITQWLKKVLGGDKAPKQEEKATSPSKESTKPESRKPTREGGAPKEGSVKRVSVPGGERRDESGRSRDGGPPRERRGPSEGGRGGQGGHSRQGQGGRDRQDNRRDTREPRDGRDRREPRDNRGTVIGVEGEAPDSQEISHRPARAPREHRGDNGGRGGRGAPRDGRENRDGRGGRPSHKGGRSRDDGEVVHPGGGDPGMKDPAHWAVEDSSSIELPLDYPFSELGLDESLLKAVFLMGYKTPTSIQAQAIPAVLEGRDVVGASQTGTGKTAAFALPILSRMKSHGKVRCLILEPTRELAAQVEQSVIGFARFTDLRVALLHGGVGYGSQQEMLKRGVDVIVATPGRLLDHLERRTLSLEDIDFLVLDEVDRMLDMGFLPDVRRIIEKCQTKRQTLFFSATMPPQIETLASFAVSEPVRFEVGIAFSPAETVTHAFYPVAGEQREDLLLALLKATEYHSVMIFTRTKMEADKVHELLCRDPAHRATVMHSDIKQSDRTKALDGFRSGVYDIIVATDVAARGIDVSDVTHVINFRVPENPEDYVHRIGRTGRASKEGDAFTLLSGEELDYAKAIERLIGGTVERKKLEGFPYIYTAMLDDDLPKNQKAFRRALGRTAISSGKKKNR